MDDETTPEELQAAEESHASLPDDVKQMLARGMEQWDSEVAADYEAAREPLLKVFAAKPPEKN